MAPKTIIDPSELDLETVIAGPEQIRKVLAQRGRLEMLDGILYEDQEAKIVVGFKDIRADDWWACDHFPGRPIFPGALMVETAAQLASYDYISHRNLDRNGHVGFGGVDAARFRDSVVPDSRVIFAAHLVRMRASMFRYDTQGYVDNRLVFEAHIMGVVF